MADQNQHGDQGKQNQSGQQGTRQTPPAHEQKPLAADPGKKDDPSRAPESGDRK